MWEQPSLAIKSGGKPLSLSLSLQKKVLCNNYSKMTAQFYEGHEKSSHDKVSH